LWDIGHAVSRDLRNWTLCTPALLRGPAGAWDETLATGSVIRHGGRYWMAYTGHLTAQIGLAWSTDLHAWHRHDGNPVTCCDGELYEKAGSGVRTMMHWRDPFLFENAGYVYHAVCASANRGPADGRGTVGLARSADMVRWEILPPSDVEPICQEMECPQVVQREGLWYLLFSSGPDWFAKSFAERVGHNSLGWTTYSMAGQSPFGPFRIHGNGRILPAEFPRHPYACKSFQWKGGDFLCGTICSQEHGDQVCDPIPILFTPAGILAKGN
jgi:beta-fructofuranosidase